MFEYKIIKARVNDAEEEINACAKEGWRVVSVSPNIARGAGLIITLEREKKDNK